MSLILEALRKSEAERRRGDAPGLRVELPPTAPPARRSRALPAWIAGGVLLALLAVALWPGADRAPVADAPAPVAGAASDTAGPASDGNARSPAQAPRSADTGAGADRVHFPVVERIQPPAAVQPTPVDEPAPEGPLAPPPMAVRAAEEAEAEAAAGRPGGAVAPPPVRATPATPAPRAGPPAVASATPASPAADAVTAVRIAGLSATQRRRLPAMRLTMHMWNDDPARRFVVIDGQRRIEGDRLGEALIVAIDREGVLLDLDGQAVRVPLP